MVNFTLFGGAELEMEPDSQVVITLLGSTEIACPTVTQHLAQLADNPAPDSPWSRQEATRRRNVYVTVLGGMSIKRPPLAREYLDLRNLLASGAIAMGDFQVLWLQHAAQPFRRYYRTVTILGSCDHAVPAKRAELRALEELRARNAITAEEEQAIAALVGQDRAIAIGELLQVATRFLPIAGASSAR